MSTVKHQPATPLPWSLKHGNHVIAGEYEFDVAIAWLTDSTPSSEKADANAAYIAHAANTYPRLIEALRQMLEIVGPTPMRSSKDGNQFHAAKMLMRELGEA